MGTCELVFFDSLVEPGYRVTGAELREDGSLVIETEKVWTWPECIPDGYWAAKDEDGRWDIFPERPIEGGDCWFGTERIRWDTNIFGPTPPDKPCNQSLIQKGGQQ